MKSRTETRESKAPAEAIWARWVDAEKWPEHNDALEWAKVEGPVAVGTRIVMKPKGSGKTSATITEIVPLRTFRTETKLPLARL